MIVHENILPSLGMHLMKAEILNKNVTYESAIQAKKQNVPFVTYLVREKILTSEMIFNICQKLFPLPAFDLKKYDDSSEAYQLLTDDLIRQYRVIPLEKNDTSLHIGISDPTDQHAIEEIASHTKLNIKIFLVKEDDCSKFFDDYFSDREINKRLQKNLLKRIELDEKAHAIHDNTTPYDEPLISYVDNIILHASKEAVSDIHLEPYETICRIRYRKDGILYTMNKFPSGLADRITTRLKVMAKLNIAEKRLPQDGGFQLGIIDVRISTCPTLFGEKIVLRLLSSNEMYLNINKLGLLYNQKQLFLGALSEPKGMILVTGPTGSGKTVTLYSALSHLNTHEKNISTAEDPIEIRLPGINQVNINTKIGFDFATVLRAFLRQDPDIIMIGEIRDIETAEIAIQAAQTGHLVLSTLHTNSAIETITRLRAMGIPSYKIAESISLIIAQRLVRQLCRKCRIPEKFSHYSYLYPKNAIVPKIIYRAGQCAFCFKTGYVNRIAIYECLPITEKIRRLIFADSDSELIKKAIQKEFITLRDVAIDLIKRGITSVSEAGRVLKL